MFMFLMFALIDLVVIGIFYAVYGKKRKYSEGMLLGVHLPLSAAESGGSYGFYGAVLQKYEEVLRGKHGDQYCALRILFLVPSLFL